MAYSSKPPQFFFDSSHFNRTHTFYNYIIYIYTYIQLEYLSRTQTIHMYLNNNKNARHIKQTRRRRPPAPLIWKVFAGATVKLYTNEKKKLATIQMINVSEMCLHTRTKCVLRAVRLLFGLYIFVNVYTEICEFKTFYSFCCCFFLYTKYPRINHHSLQNWDPYALWPAQIYFYLERTF